MTKEEETRPSTRESYRPVNPILHQVFVEARSGKILVHPKQEVVRRAY